MARAIDAYTLNNDLVSWYNDTEDEKEKSILRRVMQRVVQAPTLTPPNEPLTLEELREMEQSTPVWWDYIPCWVLVRRGSVLVFGSEPHKVENLFGYFYRRPPEGEEDT